MVDKFTGPHYQMQPSPAEDSYVVVANKGAEDSANVSRQHFSALPFAIVVECFPRTNFTFNWKPLKALLG